MRKALFAIFITISIRAFACSPAETWPPSSAELDALNTYLDENIEGIDSSTPYHTRDFYQDGGWTYYYPHRTERGAGVAWQVYCLLDGRWHCEQTEVRVLIFQGPDMFIMLADDLEGSDAMAVLTFIHEYASTEGKEVEPMVFPRHLVGIGSVKQTAPLRYEFERDTGGCGGGNTIEVMKNCPLEACSYRVVRHRFWSRF